MFGRKTSKPSLDTYTCPVYGTPQQSGFVGLDAGTTVTGHEIRGRCGHVHTLDLVDGAWVVDRPGEEPTDTPT